MSANSYRAPPPGGVKALANASAKNESYFYVLPNIYYYINNLL